MRLVTRRTWFCEDLWMLGLNVSCFSVLGCFFPQVNLFFFSQVCITDAAHLCHMERCKHPLYRSNLQRTLQYFQFSINICSRIIVSPTVAWRSHPSVLDSYCRTHLVPGQYPVIYHSLVLQWSSWVCFVSYNHEHYLFVEGLPSGCWVNLSCVLLGEQKVLGNWGSWGVSLNWGLASVEI